MRAVNLETDKSELLQLLNFARIEPVLLLISGEEFILSRADDFDTEVENLRNSPSFQVFLNERMKCQVRFSIEDVEKELDVMDQKELSHLEGEFQNYKELYPREQ